MRNGRGYHRGNIAAHCQDSVVVHRAADRQRHRAGLESRADLLHAHGIQRKPAVPGGSHYRRRCFCFGKFPVVVAPKMICACVRVCARTPVPVPVRVRACVMRRVCV
jgi:hypothetical protein